MAKSKWLRQSVLKVNITKDSLTVMLNVNKTLCLSFCNIYKYQIITMYTCNKCLSIIPQ